VNLSVNRVFSLAALTAVFSMGITQAAQQAKFHLPVAAKWGNVLLQPGDYNMTLPTPSVGNWQIYLEGAGKRVYAMPMITEVRDQSTRNYLKLVKVDGAYFVREYDSGTIGKAFTFVVPKTNSRKEEMTLVTN
jgi:hypothetical protein